jgi:hypothetical protein
MDACATDRHRHGDSIRHMRISPIAGPGGEPLVIEERPQPQNYWWQYFEAADRRDFRSGWFYFPKLTPSEQMDKMTVRAIRERSHWLYNNVSPFSMVIDGLALDEVGTGLWPKWITSNSDFNKEVTDAFHYANQDPRIFSSDGRNDVYSAQLNVRRMLRLDGDCFGQFIRSGDRPTVGFGSQNPCMHLVPGYLVENYGDEKEDSGWEHGIRSDALGRALQYRVLNNESDTGYTDVPADEMLHFFDPMLSGQTRGLPVATSIAKKMFRREDVIRAMGNGTLSREMLGFAIEMDGDMGPGPSITIPGARQIVEETPVTQGGTTASGDKAAEQREKAKFTIQQFFGYDQQERVSVPELRNGAKFKMLESNRPGTAVMEYLDSILRELAWAAKRSPEYVFFLASGRQGTNVRLMLQKEVLSSRSIRQFQLKPQFMNRWPVFWAWNALIKPGRVKATVPDDWWKIRIIDLRDISVDIGREGRLFDERVESNKMSITEYHGLYGEDDDDVEDANLAIMDRRMEKLRKFNAKNKSNFTYYDIWSRSGGFVRQAGAPDPGTAGDPAKAASPGAPAKARRKRHATNGSRL